MTDEASPEMVAELDGRMADVYEVVLTSKFDQEMEMAERKMLYWLLRMAYAYGRMDGAQEAYDKVSQPLTYASVREYDK
jgi:hypothetical protein